MTKFSEQQQGDNLLHWASTESQTALMSSSKVKGQNWEANKVMTSSKKVLFNP